MTNKKIKYIDPDPFTVMSLVLGAASIILQLPHTYEYLKSKGNIASQNNAVLAQRENIVQRIADALEDTERHLDRVIKEIERGSAFPDEEFYERSFGISIGILKLESRHHQKFSQDFSALYTRVGGLSIWVNNLIRSDEEALQDLGNILSEKTSDVAVELNEMIRGGATNRQILQHCRFTFSQAKQALDDYIKTLGN